MGFWDNWLVVNGLDSASASQSTSADNDVDMFKSLTRELTRHSISKDKLGSREAIAKLKAGVDFALGNQDQLTAFTKMEFDKADAKIAALGRIQSSITSSWTNYYKNANTVYTPVMTKLREGAAKAGDATGAWKHFAGSFFQEGQSFSRSSPEFLATFRRANELYGQPFEFDDNGYIKKDAQGNFVVTKSGAFALGDPRTQTEAFALAEEYNDTRSTQIEAVTQLSNVADTIQKAQDSHDMNNLGDANTHLQDAENRLNLLNANAQEVADIDPKEAAARIKTYKEKDAEYQEVKAAWQEVRDRVIGGKGDESEKWATVVSDTQYQQWSKDRGYSIGYVNEAGNYVAGADDVKALGRWSRETKKPPGKYPLFTGEPVTEELVQVVDENGNVMGRGYRMKIHASDRNGTVRVVTPEGIKEFTKDQIGEVQLLSAPEKIEPSFAGASRVAGQAKAALAEISEDVDIEATKEAELVNETQYAVVQDEMGESSYLTKEEYEKRKAALSPVDMVRLGDKRYLTSGDQVFEMGKNDDGSFSLSPVEDEKTKSSVQAAEKRITPTKADGSALVITDLMDGDKPKASLEKGLIAGTAKTEEDITAAKALIVPQDVTLTETAKPVISGEASDVGGTRFVDVRGKIPKTVSTVPPEELEEAKLAATAASLSREEPGEPSAGIDPATPLPGEEETNLRPGDTWKGGLSRLGKPMTAVLLPNLTVALYDPALYATPEAAYADMQRPQGQTDVTGGRHAILASGGSAHANSIALSGKLLPDAPMVSATDEAQMEADSGEPVAATPPAAPVAAPTPAEPPTPEPAPVPPKSRQESAQADFDAQIAEMKATGETHKVTTEQVPTSELPPDIKTSAPEPTPQKPQKTKAETVRSVLRPDEEKEPRFFGKIGDIFRRQRDTPESPSEPVSPTLSVSPGATDLNTGKEVEAAKPKGAPVTVGKGIAAALEKTRKDKEQRKRAAEIEEKKAAAGQPPGGTP